MLRVGRFANFNDPFEFFPQTPKLDLIASIVWEFQLDAYINSATSERYGVICFSGEETIKRPLLWSHYANSHQGIALGFEVKRTPTGKYFMGEELGPDLPILEVRKVDYGGFEEEENTRVKARHLEAWASRLQAGEVNDFRAVINESLSHLAVIKGRDWSYEEEWRMLVGLTRATFTGGHHVIPLYNFNLTEIVIGMKCPYAPVYFAELAERYGAKVMKAHPHATRFELDIVDALQGERIPKRYLACPDANPSPSSSPPLP